MGLDAPCFKGALGPITWTHARVPGGKAHARSPLVPEPLGLSLRLDGPAGGGCAARTPGQVLGGSPSFALCLVCSVFRTFPVNSDSFLWFSPALEFLL